MSAMGTLRAAASTCVESARVFLRDVGAGLLVVSHNSLALLGLCVVGVALLAASAWFGMLLAFFLSRLRGTRKTPATVCELFVTSILIPPLAVFWRAVGALRFRVVFL